jgi:peptidyl-prolyl cis-trans isomerase A (cyclophilin A)
MSALLIKTQLGQFTIALHDDKAPITCAYFSRLASSGALDGASIFRIVAQANHEINEPCPIQVVQIGPQNCLENEKHTIQHEGTNQTGLSHRKWTVSAARIELNQLMASFFICMHDEPCLDHGGKRHPDGQGFAAFGEVIAGFDVVEKAFLLAESNDMLVNEIPVQSVSLQ